MFRNQKPLHEQVIVITGASSGIGLATARMAAEAGAALLLVARNDDALRRIAEELRADGARVEHFAADVSRREDHERIGRTAIERFGRIDSWINDAAVAIYGTLEQVPIEDQRQLFDVNYWGVVYGSLEAVKHLRRGGGTLVNIGSILSDRAIPFQGPYSAAKHAVRAFTNSLRMELERDGAPISVTLIKPSSIATPYPEHARNYLDAGLVVPPPVYAPEVVARAILFCCTHPKREITVGFGGWVIPAMGTLFPRLTDRLMEMVGYQAQTTSQRGVSARRDNLYRPRQDGSEDSGLDFAMVRQSSLFSQAQMHPWTAAAIIGGIGLGIAAASAASSPRRRRGLWSQARGTVAPRRAPRAMQSHSQSRGAAE